MDTGDFGLRREFGPRAGDLHRLADKRKDDVMSSIPFHFLTTFSSLEVVGLISVAGAALLSLYVYIVLLRRERDRALWRADHDALTSVLTRHAFEERAQKLIGTPLACVFLDLNHFKLLNDTEGHDRGDVVLQYTAQLLQEHLGSRALIGRRGGDEFLALIPIPDTVPEKQHNQWVRDFLTPLIVKLRRLCCLPSRSVWISAAIGVHTDTPRAPTTLSLLYRRADVAMYHAKHRETSCLHWSYDLEPPEKLSHRPRKRIRDRNQCRSCGRKS